MLRVLNHSKESEHQSLWALESTDCLASIDAFKNPSFNHYLHHHFYLYIHTRIYKYVRIHRHARYSNPRVLLLTHIRLTSCGYKENNTPFNQTSEYHPDAHKHTNARVI